MKQETYIISNWSKETKQQKQQAKTAKAERYAALQEFKTSVCDMFDMADFYYYAEKIGCKVNYLLNIATYSDSEIYKKYMKPRRDLYFRRRFYFDNGHSITKPNPLFS